MFAKSDVEFYKCTCYITTLMRKEWNNESLFICLLLYYLRYQPHLMHNITRWATEFVNLLLAFQQVGKFWSFPAHYQYPVLFCFFFFTATANA